MNLLSELLFASDHPNSRRFDSSETRLHSHITGTGVQMKSGKDPFVHSRFDRIPGSAVRRGGQIHDSRSDHILEPVSERYVSRALQHLTCNQVRVSTRQCCYSLHRFVNVDR